jgi:DNA-binding transcriptional ArsR family regulator
VRQEGEISEILARLGRLEALVLNPGTNPSDSKEGASGTLRFTGEVQLGDKLFRAKHVFQVAQIFEADPEQVAKVFAGLSSAFRVRLLRALLRGARSSQELQCELDIGPVGQLYHHLKELLAAGLIVQPQRSVYAIRDVMVMPICMALAVLAPVPPGARAILAPPLSVQSSDQAGNPKRRQRKAH